MCCLSRRTGEMRFLNEGLAGYIYLDRGEVIHAQLDALTGQDAAATILAWPAGDFSFREEIVPDERTLKNSWDQLLQASNQHQKREFGATIELSADWAADEMPEDPGSRIRQKIDTGANLPRLVVYGDNIEGRTYELNLPVMHLGRGPLNEIIVSDASVSTRHCVFLLSDGRVTVRDLHSSNGTFVNGHQVAEAVLQVNDVIRVGGVIVKFEVAMRRPRLRQDPTLPMAPITVAPPPPPPRPRAADATSGKKPISYESVSLENQKKQESWRPPDWFTLVLLGLFVALGYLLVGNPSWLPAWFRFW